jgi:hypothetical protein
MMKTMLVEWMMEVRLGEEFEDIYPRGDKRAKILSNYLCIDENRYIYNSSGINCHLIDEIPSPCPCCGVERQKRNLSTRLCQENIDPICGADTLSTMPFTHLILK